MAPRLPAGELVVLSSSEEEARLDAYDQELTPLWSSRIEGRGRALTTGPDGKLWLLHGAGATCFGDDGFRVAGVEIATPKKTCLSAFAQVAGGFVFASQHDVRTRMCAPRLERVRNDGSVLWSTALPVEPVAHDGAVEMSADEGWKPRPMDPWTPQTWFSTSSRLTVSGDAVLACFSEMPRSGIGYGYVLSLADGTLRFTTQVGPITEVAPFGDGEFLVGYQGYGAFETLRYGRDGRVLDRWPSHGLYVVIGNDVRVIEMENVLPSKMRLVRLAPGGTVIKGAWLDGYATSRPYLRADGTLLFVRNGELLAARDLSIDGRLHLCPP
ncbi:MAG: hypothetical protein GY711_11285, partial [bacterium]|nr:hypothetical protein [bacterium]